MRASDKILAGESLSVTDPDEDELVQMLDVLYVRVSDILDMRLHNPKIDIKLCADHGRLMDLYAQIFGSDLEDRQAFYISGNNTIYASEEGFKCEIIGHEMAHAIINNYFPVPAPVKIQEVLAMYVEYNLRRTEQ